MEYIIAGLTFLLGIAGGYFTAYSKEYSPYAVIGD